MLADPRVTALGMYVEGIDDAPALAALAEQARAAGKGIVCIKAGKTAQAQAAAASHTASLAGGAAASSAFLRQIGIGEVNTPSELIEALKILHVHGPGLGTRLCAPVCSGGEAGMIADLAAPFGLSFPPLSEAQETRLSEILGPIVTISNPLDYHTFIWGDGPRTTDVFTTLLSGYDAGLFVIDTPRADRCDPSGYQPALDAVVAAGQATGKPALFVASMPENFDEAMAIRLMDQGVAVLMGLETALAAVRAVQVVAGVSGWRPVPVVSGPVGRVLTEAEGKARVAAMGVAVPRSVTGTWDEVTAGAAGLTPPYAMKGLGFAHKTEAGAVRLGLGDLRGQVAMPGATGYLVEEMVTGGVAEILIGLRRDAIYGVTLTLGMGGVTAEVLADTVTMVAPVTGDEIWAALRRLRLWPLLDGYRGRVRADVAALVATVLRLQAAMQAGDDIVEIEINPLILRADGAVAVDVLMEVRAR